MFDPGFPQTAQEFVALLVPVVTVFLGLGFLLAPRPLLYVTGLRARPGRPEAIGEGRSSFAGTLIGVGLACLLLQQPSLYFVLALGWSLTAFGRFLQMVLDKGARHKRIQVRFLLALVLAVLAWRITELPAFTCLELGLIHCHAPQSSFEWLFISVAILTLSLGLIALFVPGLALRILRLENRMQYRFGGGEPRGTLGGFYTALGVTVFLMPQPVDFVVLCLAACWLITGIGRALSMVLDRGFTAYNLTGTLFEIGSGILMLGMMFGYL